MNEQTRPEGAKHDTAGRAAESSPPVRTGKPAPGLKAKPSAKRDSSTMILLLIAGMVAIAGVAFAGGRRAAPPAAAAAASSRLAGGAFGNGGNGAFVRPSLAPGETFNAGAFGGGLGRGGAGAPPRGVTGDVQLN